MGGTPAGELVMFRTDDGSTRIQVRLIDETVWLTQAQMVELFQSSKANISEHIRHVFEEGELDEDSVVRKFRTTAADGKNYQVKHYNLDVIISVGYRVKSLRGTQFRQWALKEITTVQKQIQQAPKEQK
ncbi:virulence RhuM family protein [Corynebacterium belfantii]|nr:virulence RhuM family protein [Corynebacterium belfantii]MBG9319437.1 virulence RhuM family protein [Corynebacterium belfantii]MBG9325142.1 virulence RhuM family protein [Corynebacterium belfantii]MBG9349552.1 virulence RhuM family protein [Corynebacterium belfantii]